VKWQTAILAGSLVILSIVQATPGAAQTVDEELPPPPASYEALPPDSQGRIIYVPRGYVPDEIDGRRPAVSARSTKTTARQSTSATTQAARKSAASAKARFQPAAKPGEPKSKAAKSALEAKRPKAEPNADAPGEPETTATTQQSTRKSAAPGPAPEESFFPLAVPPARRMIDPDRR